MLKFMFRKISIALASLLAVFQLQAQSVKTLTLKEAIDLGYTNSKQLMISNAKVKEAQAKLAEAKDRSLPDVGVSGTYLHINTPNISMANSSNSNSGSGSDSPLAALPSVTARIASIRSAFRIRVAAFTPIAPAMVWSSSRSLAASRDRSVSCSGLIGSLPRSAERHALGASEIGGHLSALGG